MNKNARRMASLMNKHGLSREEAGKVIDTAKSTIDSWLNDGSAEWARNMPDHKLAMFMERLPTWLADNGRAAA